MVLEELSDFTVKIVKKRKGALKELFDSVDLGDLPFDYEKLKRAAFAKRVFKCGS